MSNKGGYEICCVCSEQWEPETMNFHNLCWQCFGIYDHLKMAGRFSSNPSEDEKFFAYSFFPFGELVGRGRLKRIVDAKKNST